MIAPSRVRDHTFAGRLPQGATSVRPPSAAPQTRWKPCKASGSCKERGSCRGLKSRAAVQQFGGRLARSISAMR
ncbi:hypothetical protein MTO96_038131 [Rhipicephalus appendiculatus]